MNMDSWGGGTKNVSNMVLREMESLQLDSVKGHL